MSLLKIDYYLVQLLFASLVSLLSNIADRNYMLVQNYQ